MASAGTVSVKVVPDLSAFREASTDDLIEALKAAGVDFGTAAFAAVELQDRFTILPKR
jgi:hypothetical protein